MVDPNLTFPYPDPRKTNNTEKSGAEMKAAKTKVVWPLGAWRELKACRP